jgi:hypothetical protein
MGTSSSKIFREQTIKWFMVIIDFMKTIQSGSENNQAEHFGTFLDKSPRTNDSSSDCPWQCQGFEVGK